jgi:hypothetical protein
MRLSRLKTLLFASILILAIAAPSEAQSVASKEEQFKRGTLKVKVGAILLGAAVFTVVSSPKEETVAVSSLMGAGMGFILWGTKERVDATKPQVTFGARIGHSTSFYFSRRW